jgi:peptidoglycan hydrolase FlgJ
VIDKLSPGSPSSLSVLPQGKDSPEKIKKAAQQFEALLIEQILKAGRETGSSGSLGTGEGSASQTSMDMADQQFANLLASEGGLGLAKVIASGLERKRL